MSGLLARLRARIPLEEGSLVLITMIWGATFIIRSALEATGPFFFVGVRFAFAALALILFSLPLLKDFTWREVWAGMSIGLCIFGGYALQTCGLQTITASKSAFITAFYVPLVPLLQWLVMKRPPHLMAWVGIALAFPGVLLLSGPDDSSAGFGWGEMLTAISALAIAMEIILIGLVARSVNARRVTIVQVLMASLLSFATMPLVGESVPPPSWLVLGSAFALGVSTAGIQYAINWAQKNALPHFALGLGLAVCLLLGGLGGLFLLVGFHGLRAGAPLGPVGRPDDAVAELEALVVAHGPAELAGDRSRGVWQVGDALVAAPDPAVAVVTGLRRRLPA